MGGWYRGSPTNGERQPRPLGKGHPRGAGGPRSVGEAAPAAPSYRGGPQGGGCLPRGRGALRALAATPGPGVDGRGLLVPRGRGSGAAGGGGGRGRGRSPPERRKGVCLHVASP